MWISQKKGMGVSLGRREGGIIYDVCMVACAQAGGKQFYLLYLGG